MVYAKKYDKAHADTDDEIARLEKQIAGVYNRAYASNAKAWSDYLESISPDLDEAYKEYQDALKSGENVQKAKDAYSNKLREYTFNKQEYKDVVKKTTKNITATNIAALAIVNAVMAKVYTNNYNQSAKRVPANIGISFNLMDVPTVKRLAQTKDILLPKKKVDPAKDQAWSVKAINSQLMQGILRGESIPDISKRMRNVTDMNREASVRNARTMCTSAENAGRMDHMDYMIKHGVKVRKTWVATLDARTRDWHADLDGVTVDMDESFENEYGEIMYPGDPDADPANTYNCRCTIIEDYSEV